MHVGCALPLGVVNVTFDNFTVAAHFLQVAGRVKAVFENGTARTHPLFLAAKLLV